MKHSLALALLVTACASAPKPQPTITANADYGSLSAAQGDVVLVPQWHLAANTNTVVSSASLPQGENQHAIYRQLVEWAENGTIKTVVVEGCEGEITDGFTTRFNGWSLSELETLSAERLDNVMTHVGLKLKAKVGSKTKVVCGDSNELIQKHQLILSDLRGFLGFKLRIDEFKDDLKKRADYVATVRDLMKMPPDSDEIDVHTKLDDELRAKLKEFNEVLHERNKAFVAKTQTQMTPEAIVVGAIHIDDLKKQLNDAHLTNVTYTAKGLKGDEAELLGEVQKLVDQETEHRAPHPPTPPPQTPVNAPHQPVVSPPPPQQ